MLQWTKNNFSLKTKTATIAVMFLVAVFAFLALVPMRTVMAQTTDSVADPNSQLNQGVQIIQQPLGLSALDPRVIVANIIKAALGLLGLIVVVLMIYAGYLWMTAGGNEEQITKAKQILKNATVGLAIILMAYSIVAFIFKMLGVGESTIGGATTTPGATQNFSGSGSLGRIIKDHFPARDQKDVPRNTKIIITFFSPIKIDTFAASSSAVDANGLPAAPGTCINTGANMNWEKDCSQMLSSADQITIYRLVNQNGNLVLGDKIRGAAVVGVSSTIGNLPGYYTITIRPYDNLGSDTEEVGYRVRLGNALKKDDPANDNPSIFESKAVGNDYYSWDFTCNTDLDRNPPYVKSVYPSNGAKETRDTVMQIEFSEAIDPSGIQGAFAQSSDGGNNYVLDGNNIFIKTDNSTVPVGEMSLTNGFTTLEFTPTVQCGVNACGDPKFCFPVCDAGGTCSKLGVDKNGRAVNGDNFSVLLHAATALSATNNIFEAIPFSGIMDTSGNALDGNHDDRVQIATTTHPVFDKWKVPDNYYWSFVLKDELDTVSPYLKQIYPTYKSSYVPPMAPWGFVFSKRMRVEPMYQIQIDENPTPAMRGDNIPLWKTPRVYLGEETRVDMSHGPFLNGRRQDYYPIATSSIQDAHFNCFYPGSGPGEAAPGAVVYDAAVDGASQTCESNGNGCCSVTSSQFGPAGQDYCCNGKLTAVPGSDPTVYVTTTEGCANYMKTQFPNP